LYIDRDDFLEVAPNKKFKRLVSGGEVRLRNAYVIRCDEVIKDKSGNITELRCSYDTNTLGANPEGRKVKGVIHWVSAAHAIKAEVRLYDRLFSNPNPDKAESYADCLNPDSLSVLKNCYLESSLADAKIGETFQFEREGYFCADALHHSKIKPIFNRSITLRDTWAKIEKQA
jgi:glutaminyl-tRNA synthetase